MPNRELSIVDLQAQLGDIKAMLADNGDVCRLLDIVSNRLLVQENLIKQKQQEFDDLVEEAEDEDGYNDFSKFTHEISTPLGTIHYRVEPENLALTDRMEKLERELRDKYVQTEQPRIF